MIIGICGVCASGKSQLSREIAQRYGFKYIEVDKYNIKLLKQFSKYLEKLYGFDASKDLDKHAIKRINIPCEMTGKFTNIYWLKGRINHATMILLCKKKKKGV